MDHVVRVAREARPFIRPLGQAVEIMDHKCRNSSLPDGEPREHLMPNLPGEGTPDEEVLHSFRGLVTEGTVVCVQ